MNTQLRKLIVGASLSLLLATGAQASSANGIASAIPAYYDKELFTILFVEFPPAAAAALLEHNPSLKFIYHSDTALPGGQPFIPVIDAVPGDDFNPIWVEIEIEFTPGHTPRQLFSDEEVLDALAAGEITLEATDEVYWCPVIGHKPSR